MKIAALIIGIFGSMAGFIGAIIGLFIGGIGAAFGAGEEVAWLSFAALGMSIVGLVGAALAMAKPRAAAGLMVVSAVLGTILIFVFYILAAVLLIVAAFLAFLGRERKTNAES